jgi:hypothetical protein
MQCRRMLCTRIKIGQTEPINKLNYLIKITLDNVLLLNYYLNMKKEEVLHSIKSYFCQVKYQLVSNYK